MFSKGANHSLKQISESGCNVVGLDWTYDISKVRKEIGYRVALQGNLEPVILYAPKEKIKSEVERILEQYGNGAGHIFNLGHGILPDVPVDNVKYFVNIVKELSVKYHIETEMVTK